jgi:hypothetical protein
MNEHFQQHTYTHAILIAGIRNRRSPFHRIHTHTHINVYAYMGDIKAIDAKHFATECAEPNQQNSACMCCFWVCADLARIGMIAEFSTPW